MKQNDDNEIPRKSHTHNLSSQFYWIGIMCVCVCSFVFFVTTRNPVQNSHFVSNYNIISVFAESQTMMYGSFYLH